MAPFSRNAPPMMAASDGARMLSASLAKEMAPENASKMLWPNIA